MPANAFKARLREGTTQLGLWCSIDDSSVAEMLAGCGYDWLLFDGEHAALDPLRILPLLQAVAPYDAHPIVRPSSMNVAEIKRLLDFGAQTLLIPYVRDAEEARLAAAAVDYGPGGVRGVAGITRASRFGAVPDYAARARREVCLILQLETIGALDDLEAIAAVPGVDAVFIGPADLAASMGHPGEPSHPDVKRACLGAADRLTRLSMPFGFLTLDEAFLGEMVDAGAAFVGIEVDLAALRRGVVDRLASWRDRTSGADGPV